jgi:hypothetical protein
MRVEAMLEDILPVLPSRLPAIVGGGVRGRLFLLLGSAMRYGTFYWSQPATRTLAKSKVIQKHGRMYDAGPHSLDEKMFG